MIVHLRLRSPNSADIKDAKLKDLEKELDGVATLGLGAGGSTLDFLENLLRSHLCCNKVKLSFHGRVSMIHANQCSMIHTNAP